MSGIPVKHTFHKSERLKSRKIIDELFRRKQFYSARGLRLFYMQVPELPVSAQYGFAVAKKNFPSAVDRNRVKRLMREAVRLQKSDWDLGGSGWAFMVVFTGNELPVFSAIKDSIAQLFSRFISER